MSDDYDERRQRRREEEHRYQMDAMYEVYRAGGNTDRIDCDRVSKHRDDGDSYEVAARDELQRQRPKVEEENYCAGCGMFVSQCECWDAVNQRRE